MLGSATLDLVIGMVFLILLLSLVCSAIREAIEARLKTRSKFLARGLRQMLGDDGVKAFYAHPLIASLYGGGYDHLATRFKGHACFSWLPAVLASLWRHPAMPSYIPSRTFAMATLALLAQGQWRHAPGEHRGEEPKSSSSSPTAHPAALLDALRAALPRESASPPVHALGSALATSGSDLERVTQSMMDWYDSTMTRVSGWYKRESQHILFWLGVLVACAFNVDAVFLAKYLAASAQAREQLVSEVASTVARTGLDAMLQAQGAGRIAASPAGAADLADAQMPAAVLEEKIRSADLQVANSMRRVADLNLPIGWNRTRWNDFSSSWQQAGWTAAGWLVTAFALSFGAPFWFDLLGRLMVVRSTIKPESSRPSDVGARSAATAGSPPAADQVKPQ